MGYPKWFRGYAVVCTEPLGDGIPLSRGAQALTFHFQCVRQTPRSVFQDGSTPPVMLVSCWYPLPPRPPTLSDATSSRAEECACGREKTGGSTMQFLDDEGIDAIDWPSSPKSIHLSTYGTLRFGVSEAAKCRQRLSRSSLIQVWEEIPQDNIYEVIDPHIVGNAYRKARGLTHY
ncbi:unnamed protein product [Pleuronectes platessa]|uniref:Uncharacterized protein n=1 Tax=Pleuronectes platessa TaxID=8262 RepID=A0A9N7UKR6_PLEPL|nr:unnamed protein product [Pleuronectes platessa]